MAHPIESALDYTFRDPRLLEVALCHRSAPVAPPDGATGDAHNERLEFLGDAVFDAVLRTLLFRRYPTTAEGVLTQYRSHLASAGTLARLAGQIHLDTHLRSLLAAPDGDASPPQRVLASGLEALFGAIYCDGGFEEAFRVIEAFVRQPIETLKDEPYFGNYKSALQEFWQAHTGQLPVYQIVKVDGPKHAPHFEMIVRLGAATGERGVGWSKREASQNAARATLDRLRDDTEWRVYLIEFEAKSGLAAKTPDDGNRVLHAPLPASDDLTSETGLRHG